MEKIIITKEKAGKRIDKFLATEFFSYSRGELIKKIKSGEVLANKKIVKPSYVLQEKDILEITETEKKKEVVPNRKIELDIIFENKDIIVINKPAGISAHPSANEKENTIANALVAKYPKIKDVHDDSIDAWMRPGIVHRLDRETSGIMVIAKNKEAFAELKRAFKKRTVKKKYVAIFLGTFKNKEGMIEKQIARSSNYRKQVIAGRKTKTKIREAVTNYKVLKGCNGYSYVEAVPETGRMHQIRVHLASMGHPIIGDALYTKKNTTIKNIAKRQMLHAKSIEFVLFGEKYIFSAQPPVDFRNFLTLIYGLKR